MEKKKGTELTKIYIDDIIKELKETKNKIVKKTLDRKSLRKIKDFVRKLEFFESIIPNSITEDDKKIKKALENDEERREMLEKVEQLLSKAKRLKREGREVAKIFVN